MAQLRLCASLSLLTKISDLSEIIWTASREQLVAPLLHAARETKRVETDMQLDPRMSHGAQILDLKCAKSIHCMTSSKDDCAKP